MESVDLTRIYIKRYLRELLRGRKTMAGDNIHYNRPINYQMLEDNDAEIRILSLNSVPQVRDSSPRVYKRRYTATVEVVYLPKAEDYDLEEESFEHLLATVEDAILSDEFLNDQEILKKLEIPAAVFCGVESTTSAGISYRTEPDAERPVYVANVGFEICYNQATGPRPEDLPDLEEIHTETGPHEGTGGTPKLDSIIRYD